MPIEDISYLLNNSDPDTHLVIVDSSSRNKTVHPTSSEFTLEFEEPFTNVYGIEVLDVSVSSTMYNVEQTNNNMKCSQLWINPDYAGGVVTHDEFENEYIQDMLRNPKIKQHFVAKENMVFIIADVDAHISLPLPSTWTVCTSLDDSSQKVYIRVKDGVFALDIREASTLINVLHTSPVVLIDSITEVDLVYTYTVDSVLYNVPVVHDTIVPQSISVYVLENGIINEISNELEMYTFKALQYTTVTSEDSSIVLAKRKVYALSSFQQQFKITDDSNVYYLRFGSHVYSIDINTQADLFQSMTTYGTYTIHTLSSTSTKYLYTTENMDYQMPVVHNTNVTVDIFEFNDVTLFTASDELSVYKVEYISPMTYYDLTFPSTLVSNPQKLSWIAFIMINCYFELEIGNYDIYGVVSYINSELAKTRIVSVPGIGAGGLDLSWGFPLISPLQVIQAYKRNNDGDLTRTGRIIFKSSDSNVRFMIDIKNSTLKDIIGFSVIKSVSEELLFHELKTTNDMQLVLSVLWKNSWVIGPPGVLNLTGTRYMILRCPEIETRIYSSFAYQKFCPGIGLFKLSQNQETVQQRLDFVNFVKKPFHPIGRLQKLTFRFELPNASFYDFRGVDMFMLLQIKYYAPKKHLNTMGAGNGGDGMEAPYRLNPNYDPDYIRYMIKQNKNQVLIDRDSDESDSQDVDVNKKLDPRKFVQMQNEYDYSSEEDFDDDGDEIDLIRDPNRH
jgi:hypothetical protein